MKLHCRIDPISDSEAFIARVVVDPHMLIPPAGKCALLLGSDCLGDSVPKGFAAYLRKEVSYAASERLDKSVIRLPDALHYLDDGDIVRIDPRHGRLNVLYRQASPHNSLLVTERCNSNCIMCSQPPQEANDDYLIDELLQAIPLMSTESREIGITGGEPTLVFDGLLRMIEACREYLPSTALHMLTNGRLFAHREYAKRIAALQHPDLMLGIPLYSDLASEHDFVVQARGAFDETVRGMLCLARYGVPVEIRVVIHAQTYARLPELARFIARNLPFASHVALMGLEMMGYVRMNLPALWIDPVEYQPQLRAAVRTLSWAGLRTSIYNHQLCLLDQELWPFARRSISDWKNVYFPECEGCAARERCGGFFASAALKRSEHIRPIGQDELIDVCVVS